MIENITNLFFPKTCEGCNSFLLTNEIVICSRCRHSIPLTNHHLTIENDAYKKFYGKVTVEFAVAFVYFHKKGIVQEIIHSLKYRGQEEIGAVFGNWFVDDLKTLLKNNPVDVIIPVPLHKKRLKERGYNQVTKFGETLSKNLNIPYNPDVLVRNVYSKTQVRKNLLRRVDVTNEDVFDVIFSEKEHQKHFLLIDDVLTTGSTLESCNKALLKIPGAKISIVCMAMSH